MSTRQHLTRKSCKIGYEKKRGKSTQRKNDKRKINQKTRLPNEAEMSTSQYLTRKSYEISYEKLREN